MDEGSTQTLERPVLTDEGDHDRFSHIAKKSDIERAFFDGIPLKALCGKFWLPTRDPNAFPVCPSCKEIYEQAFPSDNKGYLR
jgi:hypothetical protein